MPTGERIPAAHLLEEIGAKGFCIGDASVFEDHSNFIINQGKASSQDVLRLADTLKTRIKERFDVVLEEEVIYLSEDFSMP